MDEYDYTFTVFTPTHNRAHTLDRVYRSLEAQTFRSFEWLIVDDGSTDDTERRVRGWQQTANFPIIYVRQDNAGKHFAHNRAVQHARGQFFLTLDSDDGCEPFALERFKFHWDSIDPASRDQFSAVTALCRDQHGNLIGDRFPRDPLDSDSVELVYRYKVGGEKWGFQRTDVLRQFPFPADQRRTYIPEGMVWNAIARRFKTRFTNDVLRIYYLEGASISRQVPPGAHARGLRLYSQTVLDEHLQ
jgi:glycosyltransferase involved in cell wall biosynthesis